MRASARRERNVSGVVSTRTSGERPVRLWTGDGTEPRPVTRSRASPSERPSDVDTKQDHEDADQDAHHDAAQFGTARCTEQGDGHEQTPDDDVDAHDQRRPVELHTRGRDDSDKKTEPNGSGPGRVRPARISRPRHSHR